MKEDLLVTTNQILHFYPPIKLFTSVSSPSFQYFGWSDVAQRSAAGDFDSFSSPYWSQNYNGLEALFAPLKAKLSFETTVGSFQLTSTLNSPNPGLLTRYEMQPHRSSSKSQVFDLDNIPDESAAGDECDC